MPNRKEAVTPLSIAHRDRKVELIERAALLALKNEREEKEKKQNQRCYFISWYISEIIKAYPAKQSAWIENLSKDTNWVRTRNIANFLNNRMIKPRPESPHIDAFKREYANMRNEQAKEYNREYVQI